VRCLRFELLVANAEVIMQDSWLVYLADVSQVILVFLLRVATQSNLSNRVFAHEDPAKKDRFISKS